MSKAAERAIAQKYIGGVPWLMVAWGLGGFLLWLALWPLVASGTLPLWAGFIIATIVLCYSYLPTHEAQHGNIGRPGSSTRWLNELVGHLSVLPVMIPYRLHRAVHLKHHANANDPDKDPDYYMKADNVWGAIGKAIDVMQPNRQGALAARVLEDTPERASMAMEGFLMTRAMWIVMAALAWSGFALEVLMLWWIPRKIAGVYLPVTLSWAPHHPMEKTGRYGETRAWKSPVGTLLTAGMEYHLVHHLFPAIPLNKTPAAYRELRPLLAEQGIDVDSLPA